MLDITIAMTITLVITLCEYIRSCMIALCKRPMNADKIDMGFTQTLISVQPLLPQGRGHGHRTFAHTGCNKLTGVLALLEAYSACVDINLLAG